MTQTPEEKAESYRKRWETRRKNGTDKFTVKDTSNYSKALKQKWEDGVYADRPKFEGHTEETKTKMSEVRKQMWADGRYEERKPSIRRKASKMEISLVPYLIPLGYRHNTNSDLECFIRCDDKTRCPDFIDTEGRKVFEFFGNFWHDSEEEAIWIEEYAVKGWECTVLWESDLPTWLEAHKHLVTEEEHQLALTTCRVRQ